MLRGLSLKYVEEAWKTFLFHRSTFGKDQNDQLYNENRMLENRLEELYTP
jgi:hypothetical protein